MLNTHDDGPTPWNAKVGNNLVHLLFELKVHLETINEQKASPLLAVDCTFPSQPNAAKHGLPILKNLVWVRRTFIIKVIKAMAPMRCWAQRVHKFWHVSFNA